MNKSESIKELAIALAKFQGEVKNPANTAKNPFFKSNYAPLNDVLNTVRPILSKNGLSVVQAPSGDGENIIVTTTLIHESGEWIEFPQLVLKSDKATAQGAGSAITYARRYALSAILGISSEDDDDGNITESRKQHKTQQSKEEIKDDNLASEKQLGLLYSLVKQKNYTNESMTSYIKLHYNKDSSKDLTTKEAAEVIKMLNGLGK